VWFPTTIEADARQDSTTYSGIEVWGKGKTASESNFAFMIPRCVLLMTLEDIETPELHHSSEACISTELKKPILDPHLQKS